MAGIDFNFALVGEHEDSPELHPKEKGLSCQRVASR
jgi:hypothetical protein